MKHLPKPEPEEQAQSAELTAHISQIIDKTKGYIDFAKYMELALYTPKLGYYNASKQKIGEEGDFITSPEVSDLFGKSIAAQLEQIITEMPNADILEIGAGTGKLASDLLKQLEALDSLPKRYYILDISPELRTKQVHFLEKECPHLVNRVVWIDKLPKEFRGVILANELIDAFPVHRFKIDGTQIKELCVTFRSGHFEWITVPPTTPLLVDAVNQIKKECGLPDGYESEINLALETWVKSIANCLSEGVVLLMDYGYGCREYYHPDRNHGTLMCYYKHHFHADPLLYPGLQDITAHVDFSSLAELATEKGFELLGYTTQSAFLLACGILEIAENEQHNDVERYQQNFDIKMLTLPSQLGEAVKVMALGKNFSHDLIGFSLHDRSRDL